jgi:predicted ABC-type ATPase
MPNLYIISGCNGSGKTTASYSILPEILKFTEFVNSDEFAKSLSPFDPNAASLQASRLMLLKIQYCLTKRLDFAIETTLATRSLRRIISRAKSYGYKVTILYFWLNSPDLAVKRVAARVAAGGHDIDEATIRRRYVTGLQYFFNDYLDAADRWILADNSEIPFTTIAYGDANGVFIESPEKFAKTRQIAEMDRPEEPFHSPGTIIIRPTAPPPTDKTL